MAIEHASSEIVRKPWGSHDLRPWSNIHDKDGAIGEIWFQRADPTAPPPALLLKLLFTTARLSIQVHPDDAYARSNGLPYGKTEAWYILGSRAGGQVAIGLKRPITFAGLRDAIGDGSIADMVAWRHVERDDVVSVPAGTIHAIGAGLVVAEIQQRSDTTFRMFDYGRHRALHVDDAVAVADAGPAAASAAPHRLTDARMLLVANPYFVFERIDLPRKSKWRIETQGETWLLVLRGRARIGGMDAFVGEAFFVENDQAGLDVGSDGLTALVAYGGAAVRPDLPVDLDASVGDVPAALEPRPTVSLPASEPEPVRRTEVQH